MAFGVALMLGGAAVVENGRLSVFGAGWTVRDPQPEGAAAVGLVIYVPREMNGQTISTRLVLQDAEGNEAPVELEGEDPEFKGVQRPIVVEGDITPSGLEDPSLSLPLTVSLAVSLPAILLPPGKEFRWQLYLDDETHPEWAVWFRTTPPELPPPE